MQRLDINDKLYILANVCSQRKLTPNSNLYHQAVTKTCAANFQSSTRQIQDLTERLTRAYRADRWANLLGATEKIDTETEAPIIQHIQPQGKSEKLTVKKLGMLAQRDTFSGVGRLCLKELQFEIPLTAVEIIALWQAYNSQDSIEQNGDFLYIYWGGKTTVKENRQPLIPIPQPTFQAVEEIKKEIYEKDNFKPQADIVDEDFDEKASTVEEDEAE